MQTPADTLTIDSLQIAQWRADDSYDYERELMGGGMSLMEWITDRLRTWISQMFNTTVDSDAVYYTLLFAGACLVGLLAWLVWKRNPALFRRSGDGAHSPLDYEVQEDTIYGIDFERETARAAGQGNWREAVRLVYLHTLAWLADRQRIVWLPQKTPAQYMAEAADASFSQMSRHFMRVRYGNFQATEALFTQMRQLQAAITGKGGGSL